MYQMDVDPTYLLDAIRGSSNYGYCEPKAYLAENSISEKGMLGMLKLIYKKGIIAFGDGTLAQIAIPCTFLTIAGNSVPYNFTSVLGSVDTIATK